MRRYRSRFAWGAGLVLFLSSGAGDAAQPPEQGLLTAPDAATTDAFGHAVAIDGDVAVVGAPNDDDNGSDSGSAYVFERSGGVWALAAKVRASDGAPQDKFGWAVGVSGNTVVVGAPLNSAVFFRAGAVYVFEKSLRGWVQTAKLNSSKDDIDNRLGSSVAIDRDRIVAGIPYDRFFGVQSGAAVVFARLGGGGWTEEAYLRAADGALGDLFGTQVAISKVNVVVGAPFEDAAGLNSGSAYVFSFASGTWLQQQKLVASDGAPGDLLGSSVALDGDTAVVGAPLDDDGGNNSGSAYAFAGAVWAQQAKLVAPDAAADDLFGHSVGISGQTAVVGAYADDDHGSGSGSASAFVRDAAWTHSAKLTASDAATSSFFGWSAAISGDTAIIGADLADTAGQVDSGAAYGFIAVGCPEPAATLIEVTFLFDPQAADGLRGLCAA